ncbi:formimidoylglutamase [Cyclobacterium plantarum]|uniref:Formimidoylglutamase n=1 Tax=Cyclobacterium plantarum TaxID=2716263 RepID=A0ABX0HHI9_9BACT|nr:formimidoylglutamase [Cyclobacterium plantarum]NHE59778.1 formimidoylglutamase [Cyclobacterium plantarum]
MDLEAFFEPIQPAILNKEYGHNAFFHHIHCHGETFPEIKGIQIALVGIEEYRGADNDQVENSSLTTNQIRSKLYPLKKGQNNYCIADLGNIKIGQSREETLSLISSIGELLLKMEVLPIFVGGSHDLDLGQYRSYQPMKKLVSLLTVDAKMDMEDKGKPMELHSQDIILNKPNYMFNYCHLAYQSFLTDPELVTTLEKLYFDHVRLGQLRDSFKETEPLIRNADLLSFDVCAIHASDAPGAIDAQPFGLSAEEACQICWFAGMNEKLSSMGIYGYHGKLDDGRSKTASVIATMIWYFIEGFYQRKDSLSFKSSDYIKYTVSLDSKPSILHFYKSKLSGKWWMEIPKNKTEKYKRDTIIPCSYQDYLTAQQGEIPERWVNSQLKLY